jgi:hypothetical protein
VAPTLPPTREGHWRPQDPLAPAPCGMLIMAICRDCRGSGGGGHVKVGRWHKVLHAHVERDL